MKKFIDLLKKPAFQEKFNGWSVVFFIGVLVVAGPLGWLSSVTFVSYLSVYALISSSLSGWISAIVARGQEISEDGLIEEDRKWMLENIKCSCKGE